MAPIGKKSKSRKSIKKKLPLDVDAKDTASGSGSSKGQQGQQVAKTTDNNEQTHSPENSPISEITEIIQEAEKQDPGTIVKIIKTVSGMLPKKQFELKFQYLSFFLNSESNVGGSKVTGQMMSSPKLDDLSLSQTKHQSSNSSPHIDNNNKPEVEAVAEDLIHDIDQSESKSFKLSQGQVMPNEPVSDSKKKIINKLKKFVNSKSFADNLGAAVSKTMEPKVTKACKKHYENDLFPIFQTVTDNVLDQFKVFYQSGTADYIEQVNEIVKECIESTKTNFVEEMNAGIHAMGIVLDEKEKIISILQSSGQQENEEDCPKTAKLELKKLIKKKQFNDAFVQALCANDLSQVIFVCLQVNMVDLMVPGKNVVSQVVFRSLINQLSHDLGQKTYQKISFLEAVLPCINRNNPVIQEHNKTVAQSLQRNINIYLETSRDEESRLDKLYSAAEFLAHPEKLEQD